MTCVFWCRSYWCQVQYRGLRVWLLIWCCWWVFWHIILILREIWNHQDSQYDLLWNLSGTCDFIYYLDGCCIWNCSKRLLFCLGYYVCELGTWFQFLGLFCLVEGFWKLYWGGYVQINLCFLINIGQHKGLVVTLWSILVLWIEVLWVGQKCGGYISIGRMPIPYNARQPQIDYCDCRNEYDSGED